MLELEKGLEIGMWTIGQTKIYSNNSIKPVQEILISELSHQIDGYNGKVYYWPVYINSKNWCKQKDAFDLLRIINILFHSDSELIDFRTIREIRRGTMNKFLDSDGEDEITMGPSTL